MSSSSSDSSIVLGDGPFLTCWCGMGAKLLTSRTQENPGRPFFTCVRRLDENYRGPKHLFKWVEDVLMDELVTAKSEIQELKSSIEDIRASVEDSRSNDFLGKFGFCVMAIVIGYLYVSNN